MISGTVISLQQQGNDHDDLCKQNVLIEELAHIVDFISRISDGFACFPPLQKLSKEWVMDQ